MEDVGFVVSWNLSLLSNKTASVDSAMLPVYCYRENKTYSSFLSTITEDGGSFCVARGSVAN